MASQTRELRGLDSAQRMLAKLQNLDEIKEIRDKAEALRQYAKSADLGFKAQNQAAEVKLRAERRAGEILAALDLRGGDRKSSCKVDGVSLVDLGISTQQSARWQRESAVPEEAFEQYLNGAVRQGRELTSAGLLRIARTLQGTAEPCFVGRPDGITLPDSAIAVK